VSSEPPTEDGPAVTFGICPDNQWEDFRTTVRRAPLLESAGFDALWLGDHTLPFQHSRGFNRSVIVELVAYLQATERVTVGAQVIAPIGLRRQPVDVALDLATAALLHPGRVALTVGTGEAMNELNTSGRWPPPRERMERCIEGMQLIRRCWEEEGYFRFEGAYFSSFFTLYVKPEPPIPLVCAANGPILARAAGRLADGICAVGVTPDVFRDRILPAFEAGAREAGRDPARLERMIWVPTSYHPEPAQALAAARLEAGVLVPGAFDTVVDPREMEELGKQVDEATIREACCVASRPEEIVAAFQRFVDAGATHVVWGDLSPDADLVPALARDHVLPRLRAVRTDASYTL
jgi:coenzyme F420-dependent glucose-6-phosphate dehydrogenase